MPTETFPAVSYRCFEGRSDGWTPFAEGEFLRLLAEGGNVSAAARSIAMSLSSVYARRRDHRRRGFAIAWEAALVLAKDRLVDNLFERAIDGEEFSTVKDGGETRYHRPNYRLGLGFLKHLEEKQPGREAQWVANHFDEWLVSLACNSDHALRDTIAPHEDDEPWLRLWALKTFPLVEDSAKNEAPDADDPNPVWHAGGRWLTRFPPPADFDGEVIDGEPGEPLYCRTLSTDEAAIMRQSEDALDSDQRKEEADALEQACAKRDAWFANMRDDPRGGEVEECEEYDGYEYEEDEGPIEYKSMPSVISIPPSCRAPGAASSLYRPISSAVPNI